MVDLFSRLWVCLRIGWSWLPLSPIRFAGAGLAIATLGFGGCAQQPQQFAAASHGKEYFPSSKYGSASRRVVADGAPIPRGGGQYLVGRPYTVAGQTYYPSERRIVQVGTASWYGDAFHGRLTANGEIYDKNGLTAAHPTMPLPSYARVTNLRNNSSIIVRVNDRGPYASNRVMDVSGRVAEALDFKRYGTAKIKVEYVGRASLAGSDDARLLATLRTDGPAPWQGEPTMVAATDAPTRVASLAPYVPEIRRSTPPQVERVSRVEDEPPRSPAPVQLERRPRPLGHETGMPRGEARQDGRDQADTGRFHRHEANDDRDDRRSRAAPEPPRSTRSASTKAGVARAASENTTAERHGAAILPPSRPIDLGTIPGADVKIGLHHKLVADAHGSRPVALRLARYRDD